jgi:lipopolysaccharide/colanic/teichoic acid biosynthesis glycosyltransferase
MHVRQYSVATQAFGKQAGVSARIKRLLDIVLASSLLVLLAPACLAVAILIKLHDGGPVIHRRRVVGCDEDFDALKFRSMRVDGDEWLASHPEFLREFEKNFKLSSDPRVTHIGEFLRRTSLDEVPQLINVLRGEMSIVGPRMISRPELAKYGANAAKLLSVKPGLTGYWQVAGRSSGGYEERVRFDMYYVDNWSLTLDLALLARTPLRVLRGQGD